MKINCICDICNFDNSTTTHPNCNSCLATLDTSKLPDESQPQPPTQEEFEQYMKTHTKLPNGEWVDVDDGTEQPTIFTHINKRLQTLEDMIKILLKPTVIITQDKIEDFSEDSYIDEIIDESIKDDNRRRH